MADGDWGFVEFEGVGGRGTNGTDYTIRYCWVMRVEDDLVREVVGYYDQSKVAELFARGPGAGLTPTGGAARMIRLTDSEVRGTTMTASAHTGATA